MRKLFEERKLFKGGNYIRKYGMLKFLTAQLVDPEFKFRSLEDFKTYKLKLRHPVVLFFP